MRKKSNNKKLNYVYVRLNENERRQLEAVAKKYKFKTISSLVVSVSIYRLSLLCNRSRRIISNISRTENLIKSLGQIRFKENGDKQKLLSKIYSKNKMIKKLLLKGSEDFNNSLFKKRFNTEQQRNIILKIALTEDEKILLDKNQVKFRFDSRSSLLRYALCYFDDCAFEKQNNVLEIIKGNCDAVADVYHKNYEDIYFLQEINKKCNFVIRTLSGAKNDNKKQYKK